MLSFKTMNKKIAFYLFFLIVTSFCAGQALKPAGETIISFGPGHTQIGIETGEEEHWKPLFFSIDGDGIIHIPDFYKNRIARFSKDGQFIGAEHCPEGISPRMNYFSIMPEGGYVTFDGGTLYCLNNDASLRWKHDFGIGMVPGGIYISASRVFLSFSSHPGQDGRSVVFDSGSPRPIGRFGLIRENGNIALVQSSNGKVFSFGIANMSLIPGNNNKYVSDINSCLVHISGDGKSIWSNQRQTSQTLTLFDTNGILKNKGTIVFPAGRDGTGFWTYIDDNLVIYKNFFSDDHMIIAAYEFE
jgi:hypothetical protein